MLLLHAKHLPGDGGKLRWREGKRININLAQRAHAQQKQTFQRASQEGGSEIQNKRRIKGKKGERKKRAVSRKTILRSRGPARFGLIPVSTTGG